MYEYIKGHITFRNTAYSVIETNGIGYVFNHSLSTFEALGNQKEVQIFMHLNVREDAHVLYGFFEEGERTMFRHLISVSGIGPASAMAALSAMKPAELQEAIFSDDVTTLKKIKGVGAKSAQRIIVDLKDKLSSQEVNFDNFGGQNNTIRSEALKALQNLGFDRRKAQKVIDEVLKSTDESIGIEDLIKRSLKSF
ncbi:MAG: Holliday junction branch migration protein RuvA [Flavobacteriales bacterium]|nr:Holliday junction branch migration protein RuvA [Flavobacteriales bacterium]